jgi:uncharacterized protein YcbX
MNQPSRGAHVGGAPEGTDNPSGTVVRLWRYPVKSMLGETCGHLDVDARGVVGDRVFAVCDADGRIGSAKTMGRFRRIDGVLSFRAGFEHDVARIMFPDGRIVRVDDPDIHAALSDALGQPVTLARESANSHLDVGPVHLLTMASLAWLKTALPDMRLDERRFRPNALIDVPGRTQVEQSWIGRPIQIGRQVVLRASDLTERCVMVNLAQAGLPDDARVLRATGDYFGIYADVLVPGRIERGDAVVVR